MMEVIASIKKRYLEFAKKRWPPNLKCNVAVEIVEVKKRVGLSSDYSLTHCQLNYSDLFKVVNSDERVVKKVLLEGYGGSGKTMLCTSLCSDWANGEILQQFKMILFLPLYHSEVISVCSLSELLHLLFPIKREWITIGKMFEGNSSKILIVADGWNHLDHDRRQDGSFIYQLLFGQKLLPQVSVLIVSRPASSAPLHDLHCIDQVVEIHGFRKDSIRQYINLVLAADDASYLLNQLQHNQAAEILCSVPLNCALLSHLWHSFGAKVVPETMTELYTVFVSNMIVSMVKAKSSPSLYKMQLCFAALPDDIQEDFLNFCKFAFQAIEKNSTTFTQHDVLAHFPQSLHDADFFFGMLQPLELPFEVSKTTFFQFVHPVLMEYLAALYLTQQNVHTQLDICESHAVSISEYDNVWRFYFGLMRQSHVELADLQAIQILSLQVLHKFSCVILLLKQIVPW